MSFDPKLYERLLQWAGLVIKNEIDNLVPADLINEAYLKTVEAKEPFTDTIIKKYAKQIFFEEKHHFKERDWVDPWQDSWAVCTKCGEAFPVAAFGIDKGKYVDGYCKDCTAKIRLKYKGGSKDIGKKKTCKITVFNHFGEVVLESHSMVELAIKFKKCSKKLLDMIMYKGYKHKTIHPYSESVKFLTRRYIGAEINYYIKKEQL